MSRARGAEMTEGSDRIDRGRRGFMTAALFLPLLQ